MPGPPDDGGFACGAGRHTEPAPPRPTEPRRLSWARSPRPDELRRHADALHALGVVGVQARLVTGDGRDRVATSGVADLRTGRPVPPDCATARYTQGDCRSSAGCHVGGAGVPRGWITAPGRVLHSQGGPSRPPRCPDRRSVG
ncbi:hypothetical protein GCM10027605_14100 [Micromonospora zhanjiangensis]